jgi:hypothetical protein
LIQGGWGGGWEDGLGLDQGGMIPVNLSTRLTHNLKSSLFFGTPAKIILEQNFFQFPPTRNKFLSHQFLSQELNVCHKTIIPVIRIKFLSSPKKKIMSQGCDSCQGGAFEINTILVTLVLTYRNKVLKTRINFWSQAFSCQKNRFPTTRITFLSQE